MRLLDIFYLVAVWFFVLSIVSKEDRIYSAILFLFSAFNIMVFDLFDFTSSFTLLDKKEFLIKLDGTLALTMTIVMTKEKKAMIQSIILIFMVLCHTMVVLHLINKTSYFWWAISIPFYINYKELIIMSALLQMAVSYNGLQGAFINSYRALSSLLYRFSVHSSRIGSGLHLQKEKKRKV